MYIVLIEFSTYFNTYDFKRIQEKKITMKEKCFFSVERFFIKKTFGIKNIYRLDIDHVDLVDQFPFHSTELN